MKRPVDLIDTIRGEIHLYKDEYGFNPELIRMRAETRDLLLAEINCRYRLHAGDSIGDFIGVQVEVIPSMDEGILFQLLMLDSE